MLVKERMTLNPVQCAPDLPVGEALAQMKQQRIRRMPVIDKHGHLVGMVSEKDLLLASPSPATSLSVWEISYLVSKIKIQDVMTKKVITVQEDTPLEDAARIMVDNKIGGLPVVNAEHVVIGIITETDLFKTFLELLGARKRGVRVTTTVLDKKGELAQITQAVADAGGNIIALVEVPSTASDYEVMLKVADVPKDKLIDILKPIVLEIKDVREN